MAISGDMIAMWRRPASVVARHLGQGEREDRALAILLAGSLLVFVSRLPVLQREALAAAGGGDFLRDASYAFLGQMILAPLVFYIVAALGQVIARLFGLHATSYGARFALFWAYLSAAPAALLYGLALGFVGAGPAAQAVGIIWLAAFLTFWTIGLRVAGREARDARQDA